MITQRRAKTGGTKREKEKLVTTYVTQQLFDAMHEIAWRKRLSFKAAQTEAFEEYIERSLEAPTTAIAPERETANRPEKRTVTAYVSPELAKKFSEIAWQQRRSKSAAAVRAYENYVEKYKDIPAPG